MTRTAGARSARSGYARYAVMLSAPLGYLMYSAWTSAVGRAGGRADPRDAPPPRIAPTTRPTARPPDRQTALLSIAHPPDPPGHVVADQQRAVGHHEQSHRPAPTR